ncbi:MAG: recombinase RecT [bacterium]
MQDKALKKPENTPVKTNIDSIKDLYNQRKPEIAKMLNDALAPDKLFMVAMTHVRKNPILAQCDRDSFVSALVESVQLGLDLNPALGYAYLVPKRKDGKWYVEFQPGYRGLIEIANRSGKVDDIYAQIVYENEEFKIEYGLRPTLKHIPKSPADRGGMVGAYAVARLKNGIERFEYLWKDEIDKKKKKRDSLKGDKPQYSPWSTSEEEMVKKTAVRRLGKWVSLSSQLVKASVMDEYRENGIEIDVIPVHGNATPEQINSKVTPIRGQVENKPEAGAVSEPKTELYDKNPEPAKPTLKEIKDSILKCADLDELKEVWTNFNKELKKDFTPEEIKEIESVKNTVKDKLFDAPVVVETDEVEETDGSKPALFDEDRDEAKYDVDLAEIAMALNECDTEKAVNEIWKNSMNVITKLKGDRLTQIMQIKKESIARVRKNA